MFYPEILYSDNHLLVLNKPPGMVTQENGLETWAKEFLKCTYLKAVHRLDRAASGIVLCARTSKAISRLQEAMRQRAIEKTYLALVAGHLTLKEGTWEDWLIHEEYHARLASSQERGAKACRLRYCVLKEESCSSLVRIHLDTGRYHQIRIQCASRGHPILGDQKYGSTYPSLPEKGIALHHTRLSLQHPVTHVPLIYEVSPPTHWSLLMHRGD